MYKTLQTLKRDELKNLSKDTKGIFLKEAKCAEHSTEGLKRPKDCIHCRRVYDNLYRMLNRQVSPKPRKIPKKRGITHLTPPCEDCPETDIKKCKACKRIYNGYYYELNKAKISERMKMDYQKLKAEKAELNKVSDETSETA